MRLTAVLKTVHQGLVQIEHHSHLIRVLFLLSQVQRLYAGLVVGELVLGEELKEVEGVIEMVPGQGICVFVLFEHLGDVVAASRVVWILGEFLYFAFLFDVGHHLPDQLAVLLLVFRCDSFSILLFLLFPSLLFFQFALLPPSQVFRPGLEGRVVIGSSLSHEMQLSAIIVALQWFPLLLLLLKLVLFQEPLVAGEVAFGQRDESIELRAAEQFLDLSLHLGILLVPRDDVVLSQFDDLGGEAAMEWARSHGRFGLGRIVFHLTIYYRRALKNNIQGSQGECFRLRGSLLGELRFGCPACRLGKFLGRLCTPCRR